MLWENHKSSVITFCNNTGQPHVFYTENAPAFLRIAQRTTTSFGQPPCKTSLACSGLWCLYRLNNYAAEEGGWFTVPLLVRHTQLRKDQAKFLHMFFYSPWCTMIWMSVHLTPRLSIWCHLCQCSCLSLKNPIITHALCNEAVKCMCEQCAEYNVPSRGASQLLHWCLAA